MDRLVEFCLQVMMQTIPLAWRDLKVIEKDISNDTSEIGLRIPNICIFFKMTAKKNTKRAICISAMHKLQFSVQSGLHLKGQEIK